MTWASTLGTVGRFCIAKGGIGFYTSDDRGVTWTSRTTGVSGNQFHVCWTGTKFIATGATANTIYTSADGITWAAKPMPFATAPAAATAGSIISDGNGKVLWIAGNNASDSAALYISLDHGVTWSMRLLADPHGNGLTFNAAAAVYTNGRFIVTGGLAKVFAFMSSDLCGWVYAPLGFATVANNQIGASYKSGVYLFNCNSTTTAAETLVEDTAYMSLPMGSQGGGYSGTDATWNNFMPFIKVQ
jgi:hypothetical protein